MPPFVSLEQLKPQLELEALELELAELEATGRGQVRFSAVAFLAFLFGLCVVGACQLPPIGRLESHWCCSTPPVFSSRSAQRATDSRAKRGHQMIFSHKVRHFSPPLVEASKANSQRRYGFLACGLHYKKASAKQVGWVAS